MIWHDGDDHYPDGGSIYIIDWRSAMIVIRAAMADEINGSAGDDDLFGWLP